MCIRDRRARRLRRPVARPASPSPLLPRSRPIARPRCPDPPPTAARVRRRRRRLAIAETASRVRRPPSPRARSPSRPIASRIRSSRRPRPSRRDAGDVDASRNDSRRVGASSPNARASVSRPARRDPSRRCGGFKRSRVRPTDLCTNSHVPSIHQRRCRTLAGPTDRSMYKHSRTEYTSTARTLLTKTPIARKSQKKATPARIFRASRPPPRRVVTRQTRQSDPPFGCPRHRVSSTARAAHRDDDARRRPTRDARPRRATTRIRDRGYDDDHATARRRIDGSKNGDRAID